MFIVSSLLVLSWFVGPQGPTITTVPLPQSSPIANGQIVCNEILSSMLKQDALAPVELTSKVTKGSEEFTLRIVGNELRIVTKAEKTAGSTASPMRIVVNDAAVLSAWSSDDSKSISTILLSRSNGFAIWTRSRASTFVGGPAPELQSVYFTCR
jgi:hypothetical protein